MHTHEIKDKLDKCGWKMIQEDFYKMVKESPQTARYYLYSVEEHIHKIHYITNDGLEGVIEFDNVEGGMTYTKDIQLQRSNTH